ncbi:MAG: hypothetical protein M1298_00545 [Chloroflexi bacterium]|nr:hypothetical protein [Chloroflexota bacterium]
MLPLLRPLTRPLPLISLSTGSLLIAASLSSSTRTTHPQSLIMSSSSPTQSWPTRAYTPRHKQWPYTESDFTRIDSSPDGNFYSTPRFVTHIDDAAIATLKEYYAADLPRKGKILDFCSSWISHYPPDVEEAVARGELKVIGAGMNNAELSANKILVDGGYILQDLNQNPDLASTLWGKKLVSDSDFLDASTNVVSTDYLTKPLEVLRSLLAITRPSGTIHLVISNRCFPTKAVGRWLRVSEAERLEMIGDYLHFAGWEGIEIVELSGGKVEQGDQGQSGGLAGVMGWMGMSGRRDPLWVVRAVKGGGEDGKA